MSVDSITVKILTQLTVEDFQKDYSYHQPIGIYEQDYFNAYGTNYDLHS